MSGGLLWRGRKNWRSLDRLEVHRGLNTRFDSAGDENAFELAMAELHGVGFECVCTRIENGEAKSSVPGCRRVEFCAGGLVAKNNADAGERGRMKIGETARERAGGERLNLIRMGRSGRE